MKLVLLERVENLGAMGDVVTVRPGYARNYLLPQEKALRATEANLAVSKPSAKRSKSAMPNGLPKPPRPAKRSTAKAS